MDLSQYRVSGGMITCFIITIIMGILIPAALFVIWRKKTGAKISSALFGVGTFIVFSLILERILHIVLMSVMGQDAFTAFPFIAIYGGLAAGIFEESGRYIVMRSFMKKDLDKKEAVMFGIGHGGIECIILIVSSAISNLTVVFLINGGLGNTLLEGQSPDMQQMIFDQVSALWLTPPPVILVGILERIFAIAIHLCASYIVYRAISYKKPGLFLLAVLLHAIIDGGAVTVLQLTGSTFITEVFVGVFTFVLSLLTIKEFCRE